MHARKLALATLVLGSTAAHAQFGMSPIVNPMAMMNPMTMMAPATVMGMGGMTNPMFMMAPMGGSMLSAQMYNPQAMMNPYLNPMAANNPYLNPRAGMGNPFLAQPPRQISPSFFPVMPGTPAPYGGYSAPVRGYSGYGVPVPPYGGYGKPTVPAQAAPVPFLAMPPQTAPVPAAAPTPVAPAPAPHSAAPAPVAPPFDPMIWMRMMGGTVPATSTPQAAPAAPK